MAERQHDKRAKELFSLFLHHLSDCLDEGLAGIARDAHHENAHRDAGSKTPPARRA